jgi:hypothetical protein
MAQAAQPEFNCAVCNKPVDLKTAKTNERGEVVHERCYARKQVLIRATQGTNQRPAPWDLQQLHAFAFRGLNLFAPFRRQSFPPGKVMGEGLAALRPLPPSARPETRQTSSLASLPHVSGNTRRTL